MSINELIQSYPSPSFDPDNFLALWLIIGGIVVGGLSIFIFYMLWDDLLLAFKSVMLSLLVMVVLGFALGTIFEIEAIKSDTKAELDWMSEVFHRKYLPSLEEKRVAIVDYSINKDGTVNALLDTQNKVNSIGGVDEIRYYNSNDPKDRGYIVAKYVKAIEQVDVAEGYYNVRVYIPKISQSILK